MKGTVFIAVLVFLTYLQKSEQKRCGDQFCRWQTNDCGCNGCCFGLNYDHGRCVWNKCICYYSRVIIGLARARLADGGDVADARLADGGEGGGDGGDAGNDE